MHSFTLIVALGVSCLFGIPSSAHAELLAEKVNEPLKNLGQPQWHSGVIRVPLQVTTSSEEVFNRVRHGFGLLHSGWDFEAYRNFAAALKIDPECLTAYTGLLYLSSSPDSLSAPWQQELGKQVMTLAEKQVNGEFVYSEQERAYAAVIGLMIQDGRLSSAELLEQVNKRFPYDLQAQMLEKIFTPRTTGPLGEMIGNDPSDEIATLISKYKYNPLPWAYWLAFNQDEDNPDTLKAKVIPVAKNLAKWDPKMPTWQVTLGQFQMKAGLHEDASKSFANALSIYDDWATTNRIPAEYNDGFWRASIYLITNLYESGKFDEAISAAIQLKKTPINPKARTSASGLFLWEAQTLPARLYIARNLDGDLDKALQSLPSKEQLAAQQEVTAAPIYIEGVMTYIGARKALHAKDKKGSDALILRLREVLDKMEQSKEDLAGFADKANFIRSYDALNLYHAETSALSAKLKKDTTSYRLWAESALERQSNARKHLSLPPHVIQSMDQLPK